MVMVMPWATMPGTPAMPAALRAAASTCRLLAPSSGAPAIAAACWAVVENTSKLPPPVMAMRVAVDRPSCCTPMKPPPDPKWMPPGESSTKLAGFDRLMALSMTLP